MANYKPETNLDVVYFPLNYIQENELGVNSQTQLKI